MFLTNQRTRRYWRVNLSLGESPDEDVPKPELSVKVPKTNLGNKWKLIVNSDHLVVFPAPHEVLVGFNVIPHLLGDDHLEGGLTWNTIQPPPSVSRSQYTWKYWQHCSTAAPAHLPGSLGKVGRVDEVDAGLGGALGCLDVVARCSNMVSPREVISLPCLLPGWCVQRMLRRAGRVATIEISKKCVCSVSLQAEQAFWFLPHNEKWKYLEFYLTRAPWPAHIELFPQHCSHCRSQLISRAEKILILVTSSFSLILSPWIWTQFNVNLATSS